VPRRAIFWTYARGNHRDLLLVGPQYQGKASGHQRIQPFRIGLRKLTPTRQPPLLLPARIRQQTLILYIIHPFISINILESW
jgi:hypothetical protein